MVKGEIKSKQRLSFSKRKRKIGTSRRNFSQHPFLQEFFSTIKNGERQSAPNSKRINGACRLLLFSSFVLDLAENSIAPRQKTGLSFSFLIRSPVWKSSRISFNKREICRNSLQMHWGNEARGDLSSSLVSFVDFCFWHAPFSLA